jgi:hypothetical protein
MQNSTELGLPPGLAETEISIFANARDTSPKAVKLGAILNAIQDGRRADRIAHLRALLARGDKDTYDAQKKYLPAITLSGSFERRNAAGLIQHSGLLQADFDKLPNPEEVRDLLGADPHTVAAFLSPSAQGVKALVRIPDDPERHLASFRAAERHFRERYGLELDASCKDVSRLCFVSHDPDLCINPDAVPLKLPDPECGQEESQELFDLAELPHPLYADQGDDETAGRLRSALGVLDAYPYDGWIRMGLALKGWNGPGAFEIWFDWSRTAENYKDHQDCWRRWQGFNPTGGIDESAVFRAATDAGWSLPREASLEGQGGQAGVKKQTDEWPKPLPLPKEPPPPPQLKPDVLPYPINEYASASALENEASPEAVTVFLLSSIGAVTGTRFCIRPDSRKVLWHEFPVRSSALVMEVSQNKTGVFRAGVGPLEKLQRSYRNQNNQMLLDHENKTGIHSRKRKGLLGKLERAEKNGESEQVIKQIEEEIESLVEPGQPQSQTLVITSSSREKLISILSRGNERGILMKRDELSGWFADMDRKNSEGLREFFIEAMTVGYDYDNNTLGRGTDFVGTLALSVCGGIQKSKLRRYLREMMTGYKDDGLLQRFMWCCPQPQSFEAFESAYSKGFSENEKEIFAVTQSLFKNLDSLRAEDVGAQNSEYGPAPCVLFDELAQREFLDWRRMLKTEVLTQEDMPDALVAHLAKSERLVAGLALSFHAIECVKSDVHMMGTPTGVSSDSLKRAMEVWDVLRHHAAAVYQLGQTSAIEAAHQINARLGKLKKPAPQGHDFSMRDLKQKGWRGLHEESLLGEALDLLVDTRRIMEVEPPKRIFGRPPSRRFKVNPLAVR